MSDVPESDSRRIGSCGRRWRCAYLVVLVVLALAATRPLVTRLDSAVAVGPQPAATVPLFNVWTIWWNADRVRHGLASYWHAPFFHPVSGTFAFSESQPHLLLLAPLVWVTSPTTVYNLYVLGSLVLNGWFGRRLLLRLGHQEWLACLGGVLLLLLPFVHWQIAVAQLVPVWGILWTLESLSDFADGATWPCGPRLGLAFGLTYLLCNYYGLYLSVLLAVCAPWLVWRRWLEWRTWGALLAAGVAAAVLTGPVVWRSWITCWSIGFIVRSRPCGRFPRRGATMCCPTATSGYRPNGSRLRGSCGGDSRRAGWSPRWRSSE